MVLLTLSLLVSDITLRVPANCQTQLTAPATYTAPFLRQSPPIIGLVTSPPDVECWLAKNTVVRSAIKWQTASQTLSYPSWTARQKQDLRESFTAIWYWLQSGMRSSDPLLLARIPQNLVYPVDDAITTVLSVQDAWPLYVTTVAFSLVMELGAYVSWSMTADDNEAMALLFDSETMFVYHPATGGYRATGMEGWSVPASPTRTYQFFVANRVVKGSRLDSIAELMNWGRLNLRHVMGAIAADNMEAVWGYRGAVLAQLVIDGTNAPAAFVGMNPFGHWTAGCHGTNGFLRSVLRVINIPVAYVKTAGHAQPRFLTEGMMLTHGDEVFGQASHSIPVYSMSWMLISLATWNDWFGAAVPSELRAQNIERRSRELALYNLPELVFMRYCSDTMNNRSHEASQVAAFFAKELTPAQLEATQLWERLATQLAQIGGCNQIPAAFQQYYPQH